MAKVILFGRVFDHLLCRSDMARHCESHCLYPLLPLSCVRPQRWGIMLSANICLRPAVPSTLTTLFANSASSDIPRGSSRRRLFPHHDCVFPKERDIG